MGEGFVGAFEEAARVLAEFRADTGVLAVLERLAEVQEQVFRSGGKTLVAGNGGSLADAMHYAEEWTGRFRSDRAPYPALALADPTHLTCVANDYGYDQVFARAVRAFGREGDLLLLLSTSGQSPNLLRAAEAGRERGMVVAGLLGRGGGELAPLCDLVVLAPGTTSDRIQELHMLALHALIEVVEARLAGAG